MILRRGTLWILFIFLLSIQLTSQEFQHTINYKVNFPDYGGDVVARLLKSNDNFLLVVRNQQTVESEVITPIGIRSLPEDSYQVVEIDISGNIISQRQFEFRNLSGATRYVAPLFLLDDNDRLNLSFIANEPIVFIHDLEEERVETANANSDNNYLAFYRFDESGNLDEAFGVPLNGDARNYLMGFKISSEQFYFLYAIKNGPSTNGCDGDDLTQWVDVYDVLGNRVKSKSFSAQNDGGSDGRSNCGFLVERFNIDPEGNIYMTGYINGGFSTDLSPDLTLDMGNRSGNALYNGFLIKLDNELEYQWFRAQPGALGSSSTPKLLSNGDVLFFMNMLNGHTYELIGTTLKYRIRDFIVTNFTFTNYISLTRLDSDGNPKWVNFFESSTSNYVVDDSDNVWISIANNGTSFLNKTYYYDKDRKALPLSNPKMSDANRFYGYLVISPEGEYLDHNFIKNLSSGMYDLIGTSLNVTLLNNICGGFYFGGRFGGSYDISFEKNEQELISGDINKGDYFLGLYMNSRPEIEEPLTSDQHCSNLLYSLPLEVKDENRLSLSFEATSADQGILPNDSLNVRWDDDRYVLDISAGVGYGDVQINIKVTDECGLVDEVIIPWSIGQGLQKPVINDGTLVYTLCKGETLVLSTGQSFNLWSDGSNGDNLNITSEGEYWVKRVSPSGCESENSDTVLVFFEAPPLQPVISASGPIEFCEGDQVTLTSDIGENILWSTGETSQSITVSESGVYSVWQQSDICGDGTSSEEVEVVVYPVPEQPLISVVGNTQFCEGNSVRLSTNSSGNISWSNGETDPSIEVTESGEYTLYVERNGCVSQISEPINIIVDKDFQFNLVSDTTVCEGVERLELAPEVSGGPVDFLWSDGSSSSTLVVDEAGSYWLEVSNGTCVKPRVYIEVSEACYPKVYIPNVFSPNGDGINDTFQITGVRVTNFELNIYNRWGNQVFHSKSLENSWDGELNGELLPAGSYSYRAMFGGELNGQPIQFYKNGVVSLIR